MGIQQSLSIGSIGEACVIKLFKAVGIEVEQNTSVADRSYYDLSCKLGKTSFTCEVKYDVKAQHTNNLALEYFNSKSNKPSGIYITKADIWVHIIADGSHLTVWICPVTKLLAYVKNTTPKRDLKGVGDGNADILLYDVDQILNDTFVRLDDIPNEKIKKEIEKALK